MKALILAAGRGSRLAPLTDTMPKCMVSYKDKRLIDYQINAIRECGIKDLAIVGGYKSEVLTSYLKEKYNLSNFYLNKDYQSTNMVYSLFCAKEWVDKCISQKEDLIISYSDIVYFKDTLQKLIANDKELSIVIDLKWLDLWSKRFNNPLSDAESLIIENNKIIEIGQKTTDLSHIQGQYIGLIKFRYDFLSKVLDLLNEDIVKLKLNSMFMTDFLQQLIKLYSNASPVIISGQWCEIDSPSDLKIDFC